MRNYSASAESSSSGRVALVTGARSFLGTELVLQLEADSRYERVLALDIRRPETPLDRAEYVAVDLTAPSAEDEVTELAVSARVDTVVHAAFLSNPTQALDWAHELEDVGTMHVLGACAAAQPARVVMASTTMVYGANRDNPSSIAEDRPLDPRGQAPYIADKIGAERQLAALAERNPAIAACSLRFAPILGPTIRSFITELMSMPFALKLWGYDPLIQLVHETDAVRALKLAVDRGPRGPLNIVGRGVLPYSTVIALLGRPPVPLPRSIAVPLTRAMWAIQLSAAPPELVDFLRYVCVADGSRAARVLGFKPRHHIRAAIADFIGEPSDDRAVDYAGAPA